MPTSIPGLQQVTTLTFDIFGTVLDLTGSMTPPSRRFLERKGAAVSADRFWDQWRCAPEDRAVPGQPDAARRDAGYLETCRRALVYCLRLNGIAFTDDEVRELMQAWQRLIPHPDVGGRIAAPENPPSSWSPCRTASRPTSSTSNGSKCASASLRSSRCSAPASSSRIPPCTARARWRLAGGAAPAPDGRSALLRHHGSAGLRLSRRVREPLPAALTKSRLYRPDLEVRDFVELADVLLNG